MHVKHIICKINLLNVHERCCSASHQDVAERLGREAERRNFSPRVLSMDAFDIKLLPREYLVLFVASTTGQVGLAVM